MGQLGHVTMGEEEEGTRSSRGKQKLLLDGADRELGRKAERMSSADVRALRPSIQDPRSENSVRVSNTRVALGTRRGRECHHCPERPRV